MRTSTSVTLLPIAPTSAPSPSPLYGLGRGLRGLLSIPFTVPARIEGHSLPHPLVDPGQIKRGVDWARYPRSHSAVGAVGAVRFQGDEPSLWAAPSPDLRREFRQDLSGLVCGPEPHDLSTRPKGKRPSGRRRGHDRERTRRSGAREPVAGKGHGRDHRAPKSCPHRRS